MLRCKGRCLDRFTPKDKSVSSYLHSLFFFYLFADQINADPSSVLCREALLQKEPLFSSHRTVAGCPILFWYLCARSEHPPSPLLWHAQVTTSRSLTKASRQSTGLILSLQDDHYNRPCARPRDALTAGVLVKPTDLEAKGETKCASNRDPSRCATRALPLSIHVFAPIPFVAMVF